MTISEGLTKQTCSGRCDDSGNLHDRIESGNLTDDLFIPSAPVAPLSERPVVINSLVSLRVAGHAGVCHANQILLTMVPTS